MKLNDLTSSIVDHSVKIHTALGPGLLESVYQRLLSYELRKAGLQVETEVAVPILWDGHTIDEGYRVDIVVNQAVLSELKSVENILPVHPKQV